MPRSSDAGAQTLSNARGRQHRPEDARRARADPSGSMETRPIFGGGESARGGATTGVSRIDSPGYEATRRAPPKNLIAKRDCFCQIRPSTCHPAPEPSAPLRMGFCLARSWPTSPFLTLETPGAPHFTKLLRLNIPSLYVYRPGELPGRVFLVDVSTGLLARRARADSAVSVARQHPRIGECRRAGLRDRDR
jgi:hypothetical protein